MAQDSSGDRTDPVIPDRMFFRIGDVSEITGVDAHVLRFWESEFPALSPSKTPTGQRQYRRRDVETVLAIKRLLYEEKYTIPGARKALRERRRAERSPEPAPQAAPTESGSRDTATEFQEIRTKLQQILDLLKA